MPIVQSARAALPAPHVDARGAIQDLHPRLHGDGVADDTPAFQWEINTQHGGMDVQVITSQAGSVRGKHRHRHGWHYCFVVSGLLDYFADNAWPPERFGAGDMFYSPPRVAHAMRFLEDTVMVVIGHRRRDQAEYEADLEHVELAGVP